MAWAFMNRMTTPSISSDPTNGAPVTVAGWGDMNPATLGLLAGPTLLEAQLCVGEDIVIVGGGNSAGQAALYLSKTTAQVHLLVKQENLSSTMSEYLIERLQASPKVRIYFDTELTALTGHESLENV